MADLGNEWSILIGKLEGGDHLLDALNEQNDRSRTRNRLGISTLCEIRQGQRENGKCMFTTDTQYLATGDQELKARAGVEQCDKDRSRHHYMLEVIQDKQQMLLA